MNLVSITNGDGLLTMAGAAAQGAGFVGLWREARHGQL
jgi:hypothetical protein